MASTESPIAARVQHNDNGASQIGWDCLSTPVVLRIIFEHLSNTELLAASLVNKLWNYEARSVLKYRGNLVASLNSITPCQKVSAFASDLRRMNVVPFSGITIELKGWDGCVGCETSSTAASLDANCRIILDRIPWKQLKFHWRTNWKEAVKCQAFLLARKILEDFDGQLEKLELIVGGRCEKFMGNVLIGCSFPKLKTLDLEGGLTIFGEDYTGFTKALLSRAPILQEFHEHYQWVNLKENVLEGSSANLIVHSPVKLAYDEFSEGMLPALRLTNVTLEIEEQDFSVERFNRIAPLLLKNSKSTLNNLSMDAVFALPLMCYGISLEKVRLLKFCMDHGTLQRTQPRVLTFLEAFDFTRIFPNVDYIEMDTVSGNLSLEQMNEFIVQGNAILREPRPDRAANIQVLRLSKNIQDSAFPFLAQLCPNIRMLWINRQQGQEIPYGLIWKHFKGVRTLRALKNGDSFQSMLSENLDSVFCGIFPEEVAELRTKDDEYLKSVNIVPVMPSLTCVRGLLSIVLATWKDGAAAGRVDNEPSGLLGMDPVTINDPTLLFSKVTTLTAFARIPALDVTMHTGFPQVEKALSHLKPYVNVWIPPTA